MISENIPVEKIEATRKWFARNGISLKSWAIEHDVSATVLYQVLQGKTRCTRGESHKIALLLGLKSLDPVNSEKYTDARISGLSADASTNDVKEKTI